MMHLGKIPYDDLLTYIQTRLPTNNSDSSRLIAEEILAFTLCHPYYTQQLASQVWEMMEYNHIIDNVVNQAIETLMRLHDLDFERIWLNQNRTDRATLKRLATHAHSNYIQQPPSTTQSSLKRLLLNGYIIKTDTYSVEDPFFNNWIKANA